MSRRKYLLMSIALFAGTSLWAAVEPTAEELERQHRRLVDLRQDPERLKRLRENLKAYLDLPDSRRLVIAKLDRELRALPAKEQERLRQTLERYADWLEELRKKDAKAYQAIKNAPSSAARLTLIQERRDDEWMKQQPIKYRDEWDKLAGAERAGFVRNRRAEERHKHEQWLISKRFWKELETGKTMPSRLGDFADGKADKVKKYVEDYLLRYLSKEEKEQLEAAEGRWPDYPQALVAIAAKHPSALPPEPPRKFADLPLPVQHRLVDKKSTDKKKEVVAKKLQKEILQFEGPHFASKVVEIALREGKLAFPHEYLAANDRALSLPMRDFVDNKLMPALKDQAEKRKLTDSLGKWPEYPEMIQELSQKHSLSPPWHILPDEKVWKWDYYRNSKARSWGSEIVKEKK